MQYLAVTDLSGLLSVPDISDKNYATQIRKMEFIIKCLYNDALVASDDVPHAMGIAMGVVSYNMDILDRYVEHVMHHRVGYEDVIKEAYTLLEKEELEDKEELKYALQAVVMADNLTANGSLNVYKLSEDVVSIMDNLKFEYILENTRYNYSLNVLLPEFIKEGTEDESY